MFIETNVEAVPEPVTGFRGVLAIPAFRRLWLAQLTSQLGESVALVAMPLLVYALTGSAELLGLIFVIQLLPRVVLAPISVAALAPGAPMTPPPGWVPEPHM